MVSGVASGLVVGGASGSLHGEVLWTFLRELLTQYERSPLTTRKAIQRLAEFDLGKVLQYCFQHLDTRSTRPGDEYLVSLLVGRDYHVQMLSEESGQDLRRALALAKDLYLLDPLLDIKLLRVAAGLVQQHAPHEQIQQVLTIAQSIYVPDRGAMTLIGLMRDCDLRLRSKLALLLARGDRSPQWYDEMLQSADDRLRANVVEGLWDQQGKPVQRFLNRAVDDRHHRVKVNALVGLWRQGEREVEHVLRELATVSNERVQAAAQWGLRQLCPNAGLWVPGREERVPGREELNGGDISAP